MRNNAGGMDADQNRFIARFEHSGTFPIEIHFNAAVTKSNDWQAVNFRVATSALQPVVLQGLAADTEFQFANAARPERSGSNFMSYLPVDSGTGQLSPAKRGTSRKRRENYFTRQRK